MNLCIYTWIYEWMNNHRIYETIHEFMNNQSMNLWMNQSSQSTSQWIYEWITEWLNVSINLWINKWICEWINHVNQSMNLWMNEWQWIYTRNYEWMNQSTIPLSYGSCWINSSCGNRWMRLTMDWFWAASQNFIFYFISLGDTDWFILWICLC